MSQETKVNEVDFGSIRNCQREIEDALDVLYSKQNKLKNEVKDLGFIPDEGNIIYNEICDKKLALGIEIKRNENLLNEFVISCEHKLLQYVYLLY